MPTSTVPQLVVGNARRFRIRSAR